MRWGRRHWYYRGYGRRCHDLVDCPTEFGCKRVILRSIRIQPDVEIIR